jgi:hypothetical protein
MSGKGAKGLIMGKTPALNKDKKKPTTRSSRAGLQVHPVALSIYLFFFPILMLSDWFWVSGFLCFQYWNFYFFFYFFRTYVIMYALCMRIIIIFFCNFFYFGSFFKWGLSPVSGFIDFFFFCTI